MLHQITQFLIEFEWLLDSHAVDFFVKDYFNTTFPKEWQFLINLDYQDLLHLATTGNIQPEWPPSLKEFILKTKELQLERDPIDIKHEPLDKLLEYKMNPKKIHEVERLAFFIDSIAAPLGITHVLDIGSGQGYLDTVLSCVYNYTSICVETNARLVQEAQENTLVLSKHYDTSKLNHVQGHITPNTPLQDFCHEFTTEKWMMCGLHTCGDLGPNLIRHFIQSNASLLVFVGCCYNLLSEPTEKVFGYPLSEKVKQSNVPMCYSYRMIACQATWKWETDPNAILNFRKHFYRAVLQKMLVDHGYPNTLQVGKLPKTAFKNGFDYYVKAACKKLKIDPMDTELYHCYQQREKEVAVVWTLRAMMANSIESLLLLDRIYYLQEHGIHAELVPIFDPFLSPRNLALVARK